MHRKPCLRLRPAAGHSPATIPTSQWLKEINRWSVLPYAREKLPSLSGNNLSAEGSLDTVFALHEIYANTIPSSPD